MLLLRLSLTDAEGDQITPEAAVKAVKAVLENSGLPLAVFGPGQASVDNEVLVAVAEAAKGERLLLGVCMDPTTGALGYGMEYGYSVMERLRLAALQGDTMTQSPMLVTPGEETWKAKESKVGEGVPEAWGDWEARAINWETLTAIALIESGADIVVLRHPESVKRVQAAVADLMAAASAN